MGTIRWYEGMRVRGWWQRKGETGENAYTTMSAIRPTPLLRRLVHLDVLDNQVPRVQALGVGVGLGILEQAKQELGGFDGPARFGDAELFACFCFSIHGRLRQPFIVLSSLPQGISRRKEEGT